MQKKPQPHTKPKTSPWHQLWHQFVQQIENWSWIFSLVLAQAVKQFLLRGRCYELGRLSGRCSHGGQGCLWRFDARCSHSGQSYRWRLEARCSHGGQAYRWREAFLHQTRMKLQARDLHSGHSWNDQFQKKTIKLIAWPTWVRLAGVNNLKVAWFDWR